MMGKTHFGIGIFTGLVLSYQFDLALGEQIGMIAITAFSSLLPDLDSPVSTLGKLLPINPFRLLHHRGILHSGLMLLWILFMYSVSFHLWILFVLAGYTSHLIADSLTIKGIPLFFPFEQKFRLSPLPIVTNGIIDNLLFFALWPLMGLWIFSNGDIQTIMRFFVN